jgi:hypothetical protein
MNAKTKKIIYIILDVFLYIIGFPALVFLGYWGSREFIAAGIYGFLAYIPIILPGVAMLACGITEIVLRASSKRTFAEGRKHRSNVKKQTLKLAIAVIACLCGLMIVFDIALPSVLDDATDGTIPYEEIVANYSEQNKVQRQLVDTFIELNVENGYLSQKTYALIDKSVADGTLDAMTAAEYKDAFDTLSYEYRGGTYTNSVPKALQSAWGSMTFAPIADKKDDIIDAYKAEALNNTELSTLIKNVFRSIDGAYSAFNPLLIELAQIDMKYVMGSTHLINDVLICYVADSQIRTIIDPKTGEALKGVASGDLDIFDPDSFTAVKLDPDDEFLFKWTILDMLGEVPEGLDGLVLIVFGIDAENPETNNARRGSLDYMSMAWLNSVSLLGIISIFSVRTWFYLFAGAIALLTLLRGAVREGYKRAALETAGGEDAAGADFEIAEAPVGTDGAIEEDKKAKKEKPEKVKKEKPEKVKKEKPEKVKKSKKGEEELSAEAALDDDSELEALEVSIDAIAEDEE